ncbi:MurR/RpiR family transcriptional regulator [Salinisphaera sp. USBA-960]|uniref:MurR/RpiR family transcriptional regulator n=1 Tax=Salinisphaera orenii TaxID=856731 RepID=UPI000DBE3610|nr:MurR/RpiR family transcriptional regulator [Salifodinibacter halophilus]NNC25679.1 MurR/RpiR family transcriptional regulator [Salifodinibacter halophilus]
MSGVVKPDTPSELQNRILTEYRNLSARLQQIAQFVVDHPNDMALETTAVIAERANVQPSAIIRFAKAFGFSGFSELQRIYQNRLAETASSYSERLRRLRAEEERSDGDELSADGILRQFCSVNTVSLEHLRDIVSMDALEKTVSALADADTVYVCGLRRSFPVATYLAYALGQVDCHVSLLDGAGGLLAQQARQLTANDVLFAISFHPYASETAGVINDALEQNASVVVITDTPLSPVASDADICLEVHDAELYNFRSLTASMCLAQAIAVATGLRIERRTHPDASNP